MLMSLIPQKRNRYWSDLRKPIDTGNWFDSLFDFVYEEPGLTSTWETSTSQDNKINVEETEKEIIYNIVAPGIDKSQFKINLKEGVLTVQYQKEEKDKSYSYCSNFFRSWNVGEVAEKDIKAIYKSGILSISVVKKEPIKIPVKTIKVE